MILYSTVLYKKNNILAYYADYELRLHHTKYQATLTQWYTVYSTLRVQYII